MYKLKNPNIFTFFLAILLIPILFGTSIIDTGSIGVLKNTNQVIDLDDQSLSENILSEYQTTLDETEELFLNEITSRLNEGEDPETLKSVFISWSDRMPDLPEWVEVQKAFTIIPAIQVSCKLGDLPNLADLRYVDAMIPVGEGVLAKLSSFTQNSNPYIGDFPLLLNETATLVEADNNNTNGGGVIVAILSTGINENHPMLDDQDDDWSSNNDSKVLDSYDAYEDVVGPGGDETDDNNGRGTALASIVAGTGAVGGRLNGSIDYTYPYPYETDPTYETQELNQTFSVGTQVGLAPGASLFDIKITTDNGNTYSDGAAIAGIEWAVDHGADVILLDDLNSANPLIISVIEIATSRGALVIVPSGDFIPPGGYNDDYIAPYYTINSPASAPAALTVGATTETDSMWLQSKRGPVPETEHSKPDVVAPGVFMLGASYSFATNELSAGYGWQGDPADNDDTLYFDIFSSTAVASAVTAGVSARLIESFPGASPTAVKIAIRKGAEDLGFNEMVQGKGKISLTEAEDILQNAPSTPDNWINNFENQSFIPSQLTYNDFDGKRILFDGSYSTSTSTWYWYNWSGLTDGNLTTLGTASNWQHPYDDTANQYIWYNVSYSGAEQVRHTLNNLTLATGDNFTIYRSATPNDPSPITMYGPNISNFTGSAAFITSDTNYYFRWGSNGDGNTTGHSVFGISGSVELRFRASDITAGKPANGEFDQLADQLYALGADVDYWFPNSANSNPTATILEYYDIYILPQPRAGQYGVSDFGQPNASAYYTYLSGNLSNYLDAGGNVLFIGDDEGNLYGEATNIFGVEWNYGGVGGPTTDFIPHSMLTTPFLISELLIDAPLAYFSGTGTPIVYDGNVPSVVYHAPTGKGKAVFVADEDVFNDQLWDDPFSTNPDRYNNSQFALNIFYWLTNVSYQSGLTSALEKLELVSYGFPKIMTNGDNWQVDFVIQNTGNETSQPLLAFGMDWTPSSYLSLGNILTGPGDDNANDTWGSAADGDIGVSLNDTSIEFFYNISTSYPVNQTGLPMIELGAIGENRSAGECRLYFNNIELGPIYQDGGLVYYPISPDAPLYQYNNRVNIDVPFEVNLTLTYFRLWGLNFSNSLGVQHAKGPSLAPGENTTISFSFTPNVDTVDSFQPELVFMPTNLTHAWVSPGFMGSPGVHWEYDFNVPYGDGISGYYDDATAEVYCVSKSVRRGSLPLLYDITPASLDSSTSPKIVQFPGDIRVDGLTIMTSNIVDNPNLRLSGSITSVVGLGNYSEALMGLGDYVDSSIAPDYFLINDTWTTTNRLNLLDLNHSSIGPILQVDIPPTLSSGTLSGTLALYSGNSLLYEIDLQIIISDPVGKFLLLDTDLVDTIDQNRNYDKLWDQLYEMWQIASEGGYDIDSLYQSWYLYGKRNHDDSVADPTMFLEDFVCDVPLEDDLPYEGIIGVDLDATFDPNYVMNYISRGGNIIQLGVGTDTHLGPDFNADIDYYERTDDMTTIVSGSDSTNPLLDGVDQLFYLGGGYMIADQRSYDKQLTFDVVSGQNWLFTGSPDKPNRDVAVVYHDAVYPERFGYDQGKYTSLAQTYEGLKIIVGSASMTHNWFLEQPDYWAYASMKYAAEQNIIGDTFSVDLDNRKFVENIFKVGGNKAPTIESVNISTRHVGPGDTVEVRIQVSDDLENPADLTVVVPEKLIAGKDYVNCTYDANSSSFIGSFEVIDTSQINNWNIYVIDKFFRITEAVDGVTRYLIPEMNVKPLAWIPFDEDSNPFFSVISFEKGEMLTIAFYYSDEEDGTSIVCNVSLVYYINEEDTEIISTELFAGMGGGIFLVDTTNLNSGTYILFATVTDTDGGIAEYRLIGFNVGKGTLNTPKRSAVNPILPVVGAGATVGVAAAGVGGAFWLLDRRGLINLKRIFRRE